MLIVTYNLKWNSTHTDNILNNVKEVNSLYDIDFYLFQENVLTDKLNNILKKRHKYIINQSGPECMITFYKKHYTLLKCVHGEFVVGRPYIIILLHDTLTDKKIILINIHAGHQINTKTHIIDKLNKSLEYFHNDNVHYIVIGGDFNRNITTNYVMNINKKKYTMKYSKSNLKTCCNKNLKHNFDHIIYSKSSPIKKITWNKHIPASDHLLVITQLTY
jgi:hypothetical protein